MGRGEGATQALNIKRVQGSNSHAANTDQTPDTDPGQDALEALDTAALFDVLNMSDAPSEHATVNVQKTTEVADELRNKEGFSNFHAYAWDNEMFWNASGTPEDRSQYFALGNAVNFRFWTLEDTPNGREAVSVGGEIDGEYFKGSMYMWRAIRRSLDENPRLLDADFLENLSVEEFDQIFRDDEGNNPLDVGREDRIENLRDLGRVLNEKWDGKFINVTEAAEGSLEKFSEFSREFRAFDDPAQKLTMVNAILHNGSSTATFHDQPLAGIDYHLLRHALRQGMIDPSAEIAHKLENMEWLTYEEGLEIRRMALVAFTEISRQTGLSGEILDNKYWLNRNNCNDTAPVCQDPERAHECPFVNVCAKKIQYKLPLEKTRFY